ncbi:MAG: hypothetical protein ABIN79_01530 [Marmoricola sp.]
MSRIRVRVKALVAAALLSTMAFATVAPMAAAADAGAGMQAPSRAILRAIL